MIVKKVRKIVNEKLSEYPIMENQIKELKSQLGSAPICKDVNSFIKSKGKTSNLTEGIAIHDIEIEERIEEYIKWKKLIDSIYDDFKKNDKIKAKILEYKYFANYSEDRVKDCLYLSKGALRNSIDYIQYEVGIRATYKGLIKITD